MPRPRLIARLHGALSCALVLDELSEELCDAVVGGHTAGRSLAYLVANQLFVSPVDPGQQRLRYHPLFHDLRNDLSTATAHALEALQMGRQRENAETISRSYLCLARINTSLGQLDEALAFLGQAERAARAAQLSRVLSEVQLWQARAWLAQQNLPAAARVAAELDALELARGSPALAAAPPPSSRGRV